MQTPEKIKASREISGIFQILPLIVKLAAAPNAVEQKIENQWIRLKGVEASKQKGEDWRTRQYFFFSQI